MADWMEDLKQIAELRDAGVLTDDEFKLAKKRILEARETQTPKSATTSDEKRLSEKENRPTEHSTHSQEPAVSSPVSSPPPPENRKNAPTPMPASNTKAANDFLPFPAATGSPSGSSCIS